MSDAPQSDDDRDPLYEFYIDDDLYRDDWPDDEPGSECGRWNNGRLMPSCRKAGSEECDWECPYGR